MKIIQLDRARDHFEYNNYKEWLKTGVKLEVNEVIPEYIIVPAFLANLSYLPDELLRDYLPGIKTVDEAAFLWNKIRTIDIGSPVARWRRSTGKWHTIPNSRVDVIIYNNTILFSLNVDGEYPNLFVVKTAWLIDPFVVMLDDPKMLICNTIKDLLS